MKIANRKKYFIVLALLCLLGLTFFSARWGLANIYSYQALQQLEQWQDERPKNIVDTQNAMSWIIKARSLDSANPDLMSYQAQIFLWQAKLSPDKNTANQYLESAAKLYREALTKRPTWPFDWVALAGIKAQLNQFDAEFSKSIERSSTLGPWEYPIQYQLVSIGFRHWNKLTSSEQDIIHQTFDRALHSNQFQPFITLGEQFDQLELFCARSNMGTTHSEIIQYYACRKYSNR